MRTIQAVVALIATATLAGAASSQSVALRNGNFFVGYTDAVYSGGFEPKIERVYNSKTSFNGIFGWGWGTEFEVNLSIAGDGSVVVNEYGGGAANEFTQEPHDPMLRDVSVNSLAEAALRRSHVGAANADAYRQRLRDDREFFHDEWAKYQDLGDVQPRRLPTGTHLVSQRFSRQVVVKTDSGFERHLDNGRLESFSESGKLRRVSDQNANWLEFTYDSAGQISKLRDNFGRSLTFSFAGGLVRSVRKDNGSTATYRYNNRAELIESRDTDANRYRYMYDSAGRHNMTRITYEDGTWLSVAYYPHSLWENVLSVRERDGTVRRYSYRFTSQDSLTQVVKVVTRRPDGDGVDTASHTYRLAPRGEIGMATDIEWMTITTVSSWGADTMTTYYERKCGTPAWVVEGPDTTRFGYDEGCRVVYKQSADAVDSLRYEPQLAKVVWVKHVESADSLGGATRTMESAFTYDDRGNLVRAQRLTTVPVNGDTTDRESIDMRLTYDAHGRIVTMTGTEGELSFLYNNSSMPTRITHSKHGHIDVTYTDEDEIATVESPQGREVALAVTSSFQRLLDVIRLADVSLTR